MLCSPWVCTAIAMCIGTFIAYTPYNIPFWIVSVACAILLLLGLVIFKNYRLNVILACIAIVFSFAMYSHSENPSTHTAGAYEGEYVTLEGRINETPYCKYSTYHYKLDARSLTLNDETINIKELIRLTSEKSFDFGDTVKVKGFLKQYDREKNGKRFDTRLYYESRGVYFHLYAIDASHSNIKISKNLSYYISSIKNGINQKILKAYPGEQGAILCAIATGNKNFISEDISSLMTKTGTKRYLYNAHIHLVLVTLLLVFLLNKVKRKYKNFIYILVFSLYAFLNLDNPTFVRTFLFAALAILWPVVFKVSQKTDVISACVIACGVINPLLLTDSGFIVSIFSSILIYVTYNTIKNTVERKIKHRLPFVVWLWLIITVGVTPLSIRLFGSTSPYSFLLNGVYTVLNTLAYIITLISLLFGFKADFITHIYLKLPETVAKLPGAYLLLPKPSVLLLLVYYSALFTLLYFELPKTRKRFACTALAGLIALTANTITKLNTCEFHFIDVGQADAEAIRVPFGANILIDGGGGLEQADYDPSEQEYIPYLVSEGITHADTMIVSHYHKDHVEGLIAALKNIKIDKLYLPSTDEDNEYYRQIINLAKANNTELFYIEENTSITIGDVALEFYPSLKQYKDDNDSSLVVRASYGDVSTLYTGDITAEREGDILAENVQLHSNILKAPHHGSKEASSEEFIQAVSPELVVYECSKQNPYDFPTEEACTRAIKSGARVLSTAMQGDIVITATKDKIKSVILSSK